MRLVSTFLTVCLGLTSSVAARDIFVNNVTGDDLRSGGSPTSHGAASGPVRTIARALRAAEKGDRIMLADTGQPYRASITLHGGRHSGFPSRPFVIQGNGAVLDGSQSVPGDRWEHYQGNVFRFQPVRMTYQQLFLDGQPAQRRRATPGDGQPRSLKPLEWSLFDRYLYFRVEKDKLPHRYQLSHAVLPAGITLYQVRHVVISDLVIQGFQLDGVNAHDGVVDATLVGLTCRVNGRSGFSVGGASRVRVQGCSASGNGAAQVRCEGWSRTEIVNCTLLDDSASPVVREGDYARVQVTQ
jgi:hypothetical protein